MTGPGGGEACGKDSREERVLAPLLMADRSKRLTHAQTKRANDVIITDTAVHDAAQEGQHECLQDVIATDGTATHCRTTNI